VKRVTVSLNDRSYDVVIGSGARHTLAAEIGRCAPVAQRVVIVTQPSVVAAGWLEGIETGLAQSVIEIGEGEDEKSLSTIQSLCSQFVEAGLSRNDLVVAVGGGMVSDVAGFAAASYHRGIRYATIATTLLAQIDAAIGGKTGVNLPEGKNLVGAFHQPSVVFCDTDCLATLPPKEQACGRGEMAKYAFLSGETPSTALLNETIDDQVARCVAIKAAIVAADEMESDRRMVLNYGHTLAHALEAVGLERRAQGINDRVAELAHGEAVALGVLFAAALAENLGRIDHERVELHKSVIEGFALESSLPSGLSGAVLIERMERDKKAHHDLTFVLDGPRGVEAVTGVDRSVVLTTLLEMGAEQ